MINIICVGKLKDKYLVDISNDYLNRLTKYHKVNIIELKDSNITEEGDLILKHLNNKDFIVTMEIGGKNLSSVELSDLIDKILLSVSVSLSQPLLVNINLAELPLAVIPSPVTS